MSTAYANLVLPRASRVAIWRVGASMCPFRDTCGHAHSDCLYPPRSQVSMTHNIFSYIFDDLGHCSQFYNLNSLVCDEYRVVGYCPCHPTCPMSRERILSAPSCQSHASIPAACDICSFILAPSLQLLLKGHRSRRRRQ